MWLVGRTLIFPWYYCLLVYPFGLALILSAEYSGAGSTASARAENLAGILVVLGFLLFGVKAVLFAFGIVGGDAPTLRVARYIQIGSGLYRHCPSCTLVTSEIGGLGYSFKGRVYDAFGLGDPEAARFHPLSVPEERQDFRVGAIPPKYVVYRNPDFVVSMPLFSMALRASKVVDKYNAYDCPFSEKRGVRIWGDSTVQIFSRRVLPDEVLRSMHCRSARGHARGTPAV